MGPGDKHALLYCSMISQMRWIVLGGRALFWHARLGEQVAARGGLVQRQGAFLAYALAEQQKHDLDAPRLDVRKNWKVSGLGVILL